LKQKTLNRYVRTAALFLDFTLRAATDVLGDGMNLSIAPSIIDDSDCLKKVLKSNNSESIENAIHTLIMTILNRSSKPGEKFICPLKRFIIYANVLPSGRIEDPKGINATLTELKWPMRATTFWETLLQSKNGNYNNDTEL
jgi:hypothetical protein